MGKRSFRELAAGSARTSKAPAPPSTSSVPRTTSTPSTALDLAPNASLVPGTAPSTAPSAKKSARTPSSLVLGVPASDPKAARSFVPLVSSRSGDDARRKAKGKVPDTAVCQAPVAEPRGGMDVSGSHMFSESAGGFLQEMSIDSAGLLKDLMINEDGRMSFAGEDEVEETTIAAEDIRAEKAKTVGIEKTADVDGAEKAASKKSGEDEEAHS
ncbi:hypothetical protein AALP_AA7G170200 [Arabis alpina]|uniref:Uncharacterized protein n=1 Tax=Arabis alpina TaxID=50452 RepID=A0A087GIM3_ARAAL|nr:hypothetical protein AALP_AA7G170200 [Arabis alpina]